MTCTKPRCTCRGSIPPESPASSLGVIAVILLVFLAQFIFTGA